MSDLAADTLEAASPPPVAKPVAVPPDDAKSRPAIRLLPGGHRRAEAGHPWIFSNEIRMDAAAKALPPGSLVTLQRHDETVLGVATFNPHSLIAARLLDRDAARPIGHRFILRRLERALALRERLFREPYYRLIHAEADGLPGLIVDRYGPVLSVQLNTAGMNRLEAPLCKALTELLSPEAIILRNDSASRGLEGLDPETRLAAGTVDGPVTLVENGIRYGADLAEGQKTGWFFDHRDNRRFIGEVARGARVLDLYTYTGGFALCAAGGGAASVTGLDRSEPALALARQSAALNGVADRCVFRRAEVFAETERLGGEGERFDIVIADPPPFARSRKDVPAALRGYRKLARLAAASTTPGGILFIASCSHNAQPEDFAEAVRRGLADAGRSGRILRSSGAGPDHPVHPSLPETAYLKALTLAVD